MKLAKVIGTVVSTRKDPGIAGFKLLLLQDEDPVSRKPGGYVVAADAVGAGVEEYVLYASGSSARQTVVTKDRPCDAVVMAIVDQWSVDGAQAYEKHATDAGFDDDQE